MPTLPNMSLVTPTVGGSSGTWGTEINTLLALVDAHDHTSGKGVQVPTSGIDIDADLSFASNGITNLGKITFSTIATPASGFKNLFVDTSDNELYWRSNAGVNVKLTDGASINTSLVGGIVGDYATSGAELAYDEATSSYTLKNHENPNEWARMRSGDVRIYEAESTDTVYVGLKAPSGLASSYDITFPTALPGAQTLVQISAAGQVVFGNTGIAASTFTGLVTADAGVTLAANQHVTISGTGEYKHGDVVISLSPSSLVASGSDTVTYSDYGLATITAGDTAIGRVMLRTGDRVKSITINADGGGTGDISAFEARLMDSDGSAADLLGSTTSDNIANGTDITIDLTDTVLDAGQWFGFVISVSADANVTINSIRLTYDHP